MNNIKQNQIDPFPLKSTESYFVQFEKDFDLVKRINWLLKDWFVKNKDITMGQFKIAARINKGWKGTFHDAEGKEVKVKEFETGGWVKVNGTVIKRGLHVKPDFYISYEIQVNIGNRMENIFIGTLESGILSDFTPFIFEGFANQLKNNL